MIKSFISSDHIRNKPTSLMVNTGIYFGWANGYRWGFTPWNTNGARRRYLTSFPYCILCIHCCESASAIFHSICGCGRGFIPYDFIICFQSALWAGNTTTPPPHYPACLAPKPHPHSSAHYHLKRILFGFVFGCCLLLSYEDFYATKCELLFVF